MAEDDRPTDAGRLKRRGKAPTLTLEATDVTPAGPAASEATGARPEPAASDSPPEARDMPAGTDASAPVDAAVPQDAVPQDAVPQDAVPQDPAVPSEAVDDRPGSTAGTPSAGDGETGSGSSPAEAGADTVAGAPPATEPPVAPAAADSPADAAAGPARPPEPSSVPPSAATPPPAAPAQGGGFGRLVAAGLVGALLTGGLAAGAWRGGYLAAPAADTSALETRLAALDRRIGEIAARPVPPPAPAPGATGAPLDIAPLTQRLETLDAARAALETRIAALESRPEPVAPAAPAPPPPVDLDPLNREVEALKTALARVEEAQRSMAPAPAPAPAGPDMAAVTGAIDERVREAMASGARRSEEMEGRIAQLSTDVARQTEAIEGRVTSLAGDLGRQAEASQAAATRLAALDQSRQLGERAARIVGIELLRSAVDRGGAYAPELRAAIALGIDRAALEPLSAAAERGVPAPARIVAGFTGLAPRLVRAAPASGEGGFLDRLASNAQGLVRVRPVGEAAGDSVPAVVARVEAKLRRGDLPGALADFETLPEPVKAPARDWEAGARARLAVDRALARVSADALAALSAR